MTRQLRAAAVGAAVLAGVLFVDPFGLGRVGAAFADGPDLAQRSEDFADIVNSLGLDEALAAQTMSGNWGAFGESGSLDELPAAAPEEDEQVVVLSEDGSGNGTAALVVRTADEDPPAPPAPPAPVELDLGGIAVTVAPPADLSSTPEAVKLRVAGEAETEAAGVTGLLLDVTDESATPVADPTVQLTIAYGDLVGLAGGDWASRLRFVWIPDCETPGPDCRPIEIPTVNDGNAQTVTATVPVVADPGAGGTAPASYSRGASMATAGGGGGSLAVSADASGPNGSWAATSLSPSATWGAGGSTGGFTWSLPIHVPTVPAGPTPDLSISYSSAVSDGKVPSSNSQSGSIGEGFDLTSGYIERSYVPCSQDDDGDANNANHPSGDLCWGDQNATMMFDGSAVELIRDGSTNTWHAKFDDGTLVQRLTGSYNSGEADEYWKVTTADGTQYFFGRNKRSASDVSLNSAWTVPVYGNNPGERCYDADFADSMCKQVWRWNLEYVVDTIGNSMTYFYSAETNYFVSNGLDNYQLNTTSYNSGGHLNRIEYGTVKGQEATTTAPAKVSFVSSPRCITNTSNSSSWCGATATDMAANHWLDSPTDLACTSEQSDCMNFSPVFFDKYRLSSIATSAYDGTDYQPVDKWVLGQRFSGQGLGPVTNAEYPMLVLDSITHTGQGGTATATDDITLPPTLFAYTFLANRVDTDNDNATEMYRPRVTGIRTDSGAGVSVNYRTECEGIDHPGTSDAAQQGNTRLCYPVKWYPDDDVVTQYFHKYVVASMVESGAAPASGDNELITGSVAKVTTYSYVGGAAWKKPTGAMVKPKEVTYSEFRGFATVVTSVGEGADSITSRTTYFRGVGGDLTAGPIGNTITAPDTDRFQGQAFSTVKLNGETATSETVTVPGTPVQTGVDSKNVKSTRIPSTITFGFTYDSSGAVVYRTKSTSTSNVDGQVTSVDNRGDLSTPTDDTCSTITYATSAALAAKHVVNLPAVSRVVSTDCDSTPSLPTDLVSNDTVDYDDLGRITRTGRIDPTDGIGDVLVTESHSFDSRGRPLERLDAMGNRTTFTYTQSAGGLPASMTTTGPDPDGLGPLSGFATTTTFNPLTGTVASTTDASGRATVATYDALARIVSVRYPQDAGRTLPSVAYEYSIDDSGLNGIVTKTLGADGTSQRISSVIYDGLLRPFQYQAEGQDAGASHELSGAALGRNVWHLYYDSAGNLSVETGRWWAEGAPGGIPIVPLAVPPSQTTFDYDGSGRKTAEIFWIGSTSVPANEKWRTTTVYDGASTLVIPPEGGTPQATISDAAGRTVEMRQYLRDPDVDAAADTASEVLALPHQSTTFDFDVAGHMVGMHDPQGDDWAFSFDWAGRQTSAADPDAGQTSTTYDSLDRVVSRTNGAAQTVAYTYDGMNRPLTLRTGSVGGPISIQWGYDQATDVQGNAVLGPQSSSTRFVDGQAYTTSVTKVDAADRPLTQEVSLPDIPVFDALASRVFTSDITYMADGQVRSVTIPAIDDAAGHHVLGGETVTTRYDAAGLASWMSGGFGWGTYVAESRYGADGRISALDLGNTYGAYASYTYEDGTNRLSTMALERQSWGTALDLHYSYDDAGNVLSIKDQPSGSAATQDNQCFGYDGLQRLSVAWTAADGHCAVAQNSIDDSDVGGVAPYWTEYGYDPLGNRTSLIEHGLGSASDSVTTYTHADTGPHRVTDTLTSTGGTVTSAVYTYDAAGRRESATEAGVTTDYIWDAESHLTDVGDDANVYDAAGNRLVRSDSAGVTVFLGTQEVHIDGSEVTATRYYSFAGKMVAVRTGGGLGGVSSLATDTQGSLIASVPNTDWTVTSVKRIFTDPFGGARAGSSSTVPGDRRFLGSVHDEDSGLTLLGARFYDEGLGRFLSVDPVLDIKVPAQFNAYSYAWNNPVTTSDPTGMRPLGATDCTSCSATPPSGGSVGMPGAGGIALTSLFDPRPAIRWLMNFLSSPFVHISQHHAELRFDWWGPAAHAVGFNVDDADSAVYHASREGWQQFVGYHDLYDRVFDAATTMKPWKSKPFEYNGRKAILWGWKGDYLNLGAGSELAIYYLDETTNFAWVDKDLAVPMTQHLTGKNGEIASWEPTQTQWWITSFNSNVQDETAETLHTEFTLNLQSKPELFNAFMSTNQNTEGVSSAGRTVTINFRRRRHRK